MTGTSEQTWSEHAALGSTTTLSTNACAGSSARRTSPDAAPGRLRQQRSGHQFPEAGSSGGPANPGANVAVWALEHLIGWGYGSVRRMAPGPVRLMWPGLGSARAAPAGRTRSCPGVLRL